MCTKMRKTNFTHKRPKAIFVGFFSIVCFLFFCFWVPIIMLMLFYMWVFSYRKWYICCDMPWMWCQAVRCAWIKFKFKFSWYYFYFKFFFLLVELSIFGHPPKTMSNVLLPLGWMLKIKLTLLLSAFIAAISLSLTHSLIFFPLSVCVRSSESFFRFYRNTCLYVIYSEIDQKQPNTMSLIADHFYIYSCLTQWKRERAKKKNTWLFRFFVKI